MGWIPRSTHPVPCSVAGPVQCDNWGNPVCAHENWSCSMTQPLRLLLADDHESIRQGLRALFATVTDIEVVDDVGDVETAIARVHDLTPDVLLLDLAMPKAGGLTAIRRLAGEEPRPAIVVLTRYREEAF